MGPHVLKPTEVAQDESADVRFAAVNSWGDLDLDLDEAIEFGLKTSRHDLNRY